MKPWMGILGGVWVAALALAAYILQITTATARHPVERQAVALKVTEASQPRALQTLPKQPEIKIGAAATTRDEKPEPLAGLLAVKLLATLIEEEPGQSKAWFKDTETGEQKLYALHETVQGWELSQIARGYVVLSSGLKQQWLELEAEVFAADADKTPSLPADTMASWEPVVEQVFHPSEALTREEASTVKAAISAVSENERRVDRAKVWQAVKGNPLQVMREATMLPAWKNGRIIGLTLSRVPEDGILFQSGFQTGDVIQTVNGESVANPAFILQLPQKLAQLRDVNVQVERNGQSLTLTYRMQ